jgi:cytochrome c oxidase cbb3-type subunit 3
MTDFASLFWDYFIGILTAVSVIGCAVFLKMQSKHRVKLVQTPEGPKPETSHVWDGDLTEYHNPMPRWWIVLFYLTIFFSIVYLVLYPGMGTAYKGTFNWSSSGQVAADAKVAQATFGPIYDAFLAKDLPAVAADTRARQMGERLFQNNCATCHGVDARGARGFPNLTDGEWLYGNAPEAIKTSIAEGRAGVMPPMAEAVGGGENVVDVAHYVLSLSGSAHDSVRAARGREKFAVCAACHGADGKGNQQLGAPDLTNRIWMYGGTVTTITEGITRGRNGVMPAHKNLLTPGELHVVAAYVLSLAGQ